MRARRVLLTGASGFVGRQAQRPLIDRGFEVHAVTSRGEGEWTVPGVVVHRCDLLDTARAGALVAEVRASHLLHLAWYAVPGRFWDSLENLRWVAASLGLARAFAEHGGERLVAAGTCAEYDWSHGICRESDTPLRPRTLYGVCKNALRAMLASAAAQLGISCAWGRLFFMYGPHEADGRLVSSIVRSLLQGRPVECTHGRQIRDFMDVRDVAQAMVALLDAEVDDAVNVASGEPRPVADVIRIVADTVGRPDLVRWGARAPRPDEPTRLEADVTRLREEVGFAPRYPLRAGLGDAVRWRQGGAGAAS